LEEAKPTITCPRCNRELTYLIQMIGMPTLKCPECGSFIKREAVPEGMEVRVVERPAKPEAKPKPKPKPKTTRELFEEPKSPHEVLREVLTEHGLNEAFIEYAVKRSERLGGIHPADLQGMLRDMKSGVSKASQIKYIVEDYYYALQRESERAKKLGRAFSYPLFPKGEERRPPAYGYPPGYPEYGYYPPEYYYPPEGYGRYPPMRPYYYPPPKREEGLTKEDVKKVVEEAVKAKKSEEEVKDLRERLIKLESGLNERIKQAVEPTLKEIKEKLETLPAQIQPTTPPDVVTKKDLEEAIEKKYKSEYVKVLEEHSKRLEKQLEEERKFFRSEIDKLREKIEEAGKPTTPISTEGYRRDEVRLLADAMNILGQKEPMKWIYKGMTIMVKPTLEEKPAEEMPKGEGADVLSLLPKEMVE